ncbi:hypothetical protein DCAR_0100074 [Daucus carota subsp. sativus]|uniref:NAD(P)H-quinone oxidoreductase subunit 5, chloroplastic n=1 Tax=Daucus carota subsp. sativus TaxID=79200 RepID=A0AAF0VZA0_DAUCS|nr:hypothetical protein DCAR_0100074 [Daucus carota subsp. sativus]
MFRIYLLTFEGHLNVHFQNYSGKKNTPFYSISLWGKEDSKRINKNFSLLTMKNPEIFSFFSKKTYQIDQNARNITQPFITITLRLDILSKWLTPSINLLHKNLNNSIGWYEFLKDALFSVSIAIFGIFIAFFLYKPVYSSLQNWDLINSFVKTGPKRILLDKIINGIYDWSYNRGYIDAFYARFFIGGIRGLAKLTSFFDRRVIDGITNGVGVLSFFLGEGIKSIGGGRISSYLFLYFFFVAILLLIINFY